MCTFSPIHCICISLVVINSTAGHPIDKATKDNKPELKDETHYPNGTVVGKYSYTDGEGNPIKVQYYADKTSYGVELNSIKFFETTLNNTYQKNKTNMNMDILMKPLPPLLDLASEIMSFHKEPAKNLYKVTPNKGDKTNIINPKPKISPKMINPDYETFYQNEVKAPKQCENEKVKVYLVKEKRKTRSLMLDNPHANNYCENL